MPLRVLMLLLALVAAVLAPTAGVPEPARAGAVVTAPALRVGVGRADITPPTGYFTMGNVRSDARAKGQHTRLQARAIVLERGDERVALVVTDLCCVAGGLLAEAAKRLEGTGITERTMVVSGTHTHSAPGQYFPYSAYNIAFPNVGTPTEFGIQPDRQLYGFLARRLAVSIRRALRDLAPGAAAWGRTEIPQGLVRNRSIEAHLANYGIDKDLGEGQPSDSPEGADSTVDTALEVLRVDKQVGGRLVPVGMWSSFANHGTVNLGKRSENYNGDHLGAAMLASEDALRSRGGVPAGQDVVTAFSNADEGDASSALNRTGPAAAEYVGRVEAAAMVRAWEDAGSRLSTTPELDVRWTRFCFCGQETHEGAVDDKAVPGLPLLTGSDEHRGQLSENTGGANFEGRRLPAEVGPQGNKIQLEPQGVPIPAGAPLALVRVGDGVIASNPGEVTTEVGRQVRDAVSSELAGTGVRSVAIAGLANEYQGYFTTPEEYAWQAYEGGQTNFGKYSSVLLVEQTRALAASLAAGRPAPAAYAFDPTNGMEPDMTPFPRGAKRGVRLEEPARTPRLGEATYSWRGGARGTDRPLDRAFVTVQRRTPAGWSAVDSDLGMHVSWRVEGNEQAPLGAGYLAPADRGDYTARWEVPLGAAQGEYRFVVTANRYRLASTAFRVARGRLLSVVPVRSEAGTAAFLLAYPTAEPYADLTYRPRAASGAAVTVRVDGVPVRVVPDRLGVCTVRAPRDAVVVVPARTVGDRWGNSTGSLVRFRAGEATHAPPRAPYPVLGW
jgi:hypothetical protein